MVVTRIVLAVRLLAISTAGFAALAQAQAQTFPNRLIKIVVPYPAGGPSDVAARLVAQPLTASL